MPDEPREWEVDSGMASIRGLWLFDSVDVSKEIPSSVLRNCLILFFLDQSKVETRCIDMFFSVDLRDTLVLPRLLDRPVQDSLSPSRELLVRAHNHMPEVGWVLRGGRTRELWH